MADLHHTIAVRSDDEIRIRYSAEHDLVSIFIGDGNQLHMMLAPANFERLRAIFNALVLPVDNQ